MPTQQEKLRAQRKFERLKHFLQARLGDKNKKLEIVREVQKTKGKEAIFRKRFLFPVLNEYFKEHSIEVVTEGVNSEGRTRLRKEFLGVKPAVDFLFKPEDPSLFPSPYKIPIPLDSVGEVKYGKLNFRLFSTGLGQIIGYLKASQFEEKPKIYGYYIFFNTDVDKDITDRDREFLDELWEKENIFVVII